MDFSSDFTMTIDGAAHRGEAFIDVLNPATEAVIAAAPDCSREELDAAVEAAGKAFPAWSAMPFDERRALLLRLADALLEQVEPMARLLTSEQGKPIADAINEVGGAAMYLKGICALDLPVTITEPEDGQGRVVETHHCPIGVVGGIAPWNFPVLLGMFKLAPALLAGNTLVLKPSPFTPLATLKLGELARDILPPGVLNVVSGGDALGPWMTSHPGFGKISFTGSTQTGRRVMESASASLKRVTLELGGNDAAIVLPDVDVDAVAEQLFWSAFRNSGQVCIATKRMYVHSKIYDRLKDALVAYAATVKIGDGAEADTRLGPVNNRPQYERVLDLVADAKSQGYRLAAGSEPERGPGFFIPVTIVDNPPEESRIVQEEQFGPVLPLLKFDEIDEAVARANASPYGLGGSVWSGSEEGALEVARRLDTGNIWINGLQYLTPLASFGGQKQSGIGVEGGVGGLLEYTVPRTFIRNRV